MVSTQSLGKTLILTGPTASGKTALAMELAQKHAALEIINADSLLVYRTLNIGTAKPTAQELQSVPHHLIDIRWPNEPFTAGDFVREAESALQDVHSRGKRALITGGTGFYLKALLYGLWDAPKTDAALRAELEGYSSQELYRELEQKDAESALRIGLNDRYRLIRAIELIRLSGKTPTELQSLQPDTPNPRFELWVVDRGSDELTARIEARTRAMLQAGLIEEVRALREKYPHSRALSSVGYRQVCAFLDGIHPDGRKPEPGVAGLESEIGLATRQLVKQQRTWFRGQKNARWYTLDRDRDLLLSDFGKLYGINPS